MRISLFVLTLHIRGVTRLTRIVPSVITGTANDIVVAAATVSVLF